MNKTKQNINIEMKRKLRPLFDDDFIDRAAETFVIALGEVLDDVERKPRMISGG